ncbi:MAG: hypothetical protein IPJ06_00330 [Saprospiraceae bacterium]|nr:hypothetical protein [Saprospiraceae bacterium]
MNREKNMNWIIQGIHTLESADLYKKIQSGLYALIGILHLGCPVYLLIKGAEIGMFDYQDSLSELVTKEMGFGILIWLLVAVASWLNFQFWMHQYRQLGQLVNVDHDFIATPLISHLIQVLGIWLGVNLAIVGTIVSILLLGMYEELQFPFFGSDEAFEERIVLIIFMNPVLGYSIILITRFLAEQLRGITTIAFHAAQLSHGLKGM